MRKGDFIFVLALIAAIGFIVSPWTHPLFVTATNAHPYLMGFAKFAVLATMGDLLAFRLMNKRWSILTGQVLRTINWGFVGMVVVLMFGIFSTGVTAQMEKGMLPGAGIPIVTAFLISLCMNVLSAPFLMGAHRFGDVLIDLKFGKENKGKPITRKRAIEAANWGGFVDFTVLKVIPFFWVPAHTISFLLPAEYRVVFAASLSIAMGILQAYSKRSVKK